MAAKLRFGNYPFNETSVAEGLPGMPGPSRRVRATWATARSAVSRRWRGHPISSPDSVPVTSAAVSAATVRHGVSDWVDPAVTGNLARTGSVSGARAVTAITVADHGIRGRRVVVATAMGLGGSGGIRCLG